MLTTTHLCKLCGWHMDHINNILYTLVEADDLQYQVKYIFKCKSCNDYYLWTDNNDGICVEWISIGLENEGDRCPQLVSHCIGTFSHIRLYKSDMKIDCLGILTPQAAKQWQERLRMLKVFG